MISLLKNEYIFNNNNNNPYHCFQKSKLKRGHVTGLDDVVGHSPSAVPKN